MITYQYIEFSLRFCLHRCHATIKFRLDDCLPYESPFNAIEDAALGRLIEMYKVFTSNNSLIIDLRKIKSERDRIAHQGYVLTLEEQVNDVFLSEKMKELEASHEEAEACLKGLRTEMEKTDEVVKSSYSELRIKQASKGVTIPETPEIEGVSE